MRKLILAAALAAPALPGMATTNSSQQVELLPGDYSLHFYVMDRRKYATELEFSVDESLQLHSLSSKLHGRERCNGTLAGYQGNSSKLEISERPTGQDNGGCAKLSYQLELVPAQRFQLEPSKRLQKITVLLNGKPVATSIQKLDYRPLPLANFMQQHQVWPAHQVLASGNPDLIEQYQRVLKSPDLIAQAKATYQKYSTPEYETNKAWNKFHQQIKRIAAPEENQQHRLAAEQSLAALIDKLRADARQLQLPPAAFDWRAQTAFGAHYFDIIYENGLMLALPSVHANNLLAAYDESMIIPTKNSCPKRAASPFSDLLRVDLKGSDIRLSQIYRHDQQIGTFDQLHIDDMNNWRWPHENELRRSNAATKWQISLCDNQSSPMLLARGKDGMRAIGYRIKTYYDTGTHWEHGALHASKSLFAPVRTANSIEQAVFENDLFSTVQRINAYADKLAELALNSEPGNNDYQTKVRWLAYNAAIQHVLGTPYLSQVQYDAQTQTVHAIVTSAQAADFHHKVSFKVPTSNADSIKQQLADKALIPSLQLDKNLNVIKAELISNQNLIELDYLVAQSSDSIEGFDQFMRQHPNASQFNAATQRKLELIEIARRKEEERQRQLAEAERQRQLQLEEERRAYMEPKRQGDLVCKPGSVAFGLIKQEVRAYVEQVSGERIQLRIANTGGQTMHYQGVPLRVDTLIWDEYYEWMKCK